LNEGELVFSFLSSAFEQMEGRNLRSGIRENSDVSPSTPNSHESGYISGSSSEVFGVRALNAVGESQPGFLPLGKREMKREFWA
jgi:hypothetical protein